MNATEIAATLSVRARRRLPPLPSPRQQTGQILDSRRHKQRQGALALRAPRASRHSRKMDRRRDQQAWISARSHPSAHRRSIAAPRHGGGPRVPLITAVHSRQWRRRRGRAALLGSTPKRPAKANFVRPRKALGRFGGFPTGTTLLADEGIETVLSLVTAVPGIHAAAALSAGSLGAFEPPPEPRLAGHCPR